MGVLLHIWYSEERGDWAGPQPVKAPFSAQYIITAQRNMFPETVQALY